METERYYDAQNISSPSFVHASKSDESINRSTNRTGFVGYTSIEQALLRPSLAEKCQFLKAAFKESDFKCFIHDYPQLVQRIFGVAGHAPGWRIESMRKTPNDSDGVLSLLHPQGSLFDFIHKLVAENILFDFPVSSLSNAMIKSIEKDLNAADNVRGKTISLSQLQNIQLDAFEYYFFAFMLKLTESSTKSQALYLDPENWIYPYLFSEYLKHFLPLSKSATTPPLASCKPSIHTIRPVSISTPKRCGLGLLKFRSGPVVRPLPEQGHSGSHEVSDLTAKFLQATAEIWFGQAGTPSQSSSVPQKNEWLPSHDLLKVIQMLVTHVHTFNGLVPAPDNDKSPSALTRAILIHHIQQPLFNFFKYYIEKWPLDTSFKPLLETWLTFVQPWRCSPDPDAIDKWTSFIQRFYPFYYVLLQCVLTRFIRVDLTSLKMVEQLSLVSKAFSAEKLVLLLREVDTQFKNIAYSEAAKTNFAEDTYITHSITGYDTDPSPILYQSLLPDATGGCLLGAISNAVERIQQMKLELEQTLVSTPNNHIMKFLGLSELNQAATENTEKSLEATLNLLEQCAGEISKVFNVKVPDKHDISAMDTVSEKHYSQVPDHRRAGDGSIELTDLGRFQIVNGLKKFPVIEYSGDADLQPIRSYEWEYAVLQLRKLSSFLDQKYGEKMTELYQNQNIIGYIARKLLIPPKTSKTEEQRPRISLRFLANTQLLLLLLSISFLLFITNGYPFLLLVLLGLLLTFVLFILSK